MKLLLSNKIRKYGALFLALYIFFGSFSGFIVPDAVYAKNGPTVTESNKDEKDNVIDGKMIVEYTNETSSFFLEVMKVAGTASDGKLNSPSSVMSVIPGLRASFLKIGGVEDKNKNTVFGNTAKHLGSALDVAVKGADYYGYANKALQQVSTGASALSKALGYVTVPFKFFAQENALLNQGALLNSGATSKFSKAFLVERFLRPAASSGMAQTISRYAAPLAVLGIGLGVHEVATADNGFDTASGVMSIIGGIAGAALPFAGPAAPILAGVVLVTALAGLAIKNRKAIANGFRRVVNGAKKLAGSARKAASRAYSNAKSAVKKAASNAKKAASKAYSNAKKAVKKRFSSAKKAAGKAYSYAKKTVKKVVSGAKKAVGKAYSYAKKTVKKATSGVKKAYSYAKKTVKKAVSNTKKAARKTYSNAKKAVKKAVSKPKKAASKAYSYAKKSVKKAVSSTKKTVKKAYSYAKKTVKKAYSAPKKAASKAYSYAKKTVKKAYSAPKKAATKAYSYAKKTVTKAYSAPKKAASKAYSYTKKAASQAKSKASSVVKSASKKASSIFGGIRRAFR